MLMWRGSEAIGLFNLVATNAGNAPKLNDAPAMCWVFDTVCSLTPVPLKFIDGLPVVEKRGQWVQAGARKVIKQRGELTNAITEGRPELSAGCGLNAAVSTHERLCQHCRRPVCPLRPRALGAHSK